MEAIIPIAIWTVIILIGLGVLTMLVFGLRNATYGKINPFTVAMVVVPLILLVVLGFSMDDWGMAGILTVIIMLGLGAVALLLSGLRSVLGW